MAKDFMSELNYRRLNFRSVFKYVLKSALIFFSIQSAAQIKMAGQQDSSFSTFYQQRSSLFRILPQTRPAIVFLGNSITNGSEWSELFNDPNIINRGISSDVTAGVTNRLDEVTKRKPEKIFLLIGINDLAAGRSPDSVAKDILRISSTIHKETPLTKVYVQSILPVNDHFNKFKGHVNKGQQIKRLNALLKDAADKSNFTYVDLYSAFCNTDEKLDTLYTNDGLHQKGPGYMLWKHLIYPLVYNLQEKPSLIPKPVNLTWTADRFLIYKCRSILLEEASFGKEAAFLKNELNLAGWKVNVVNNNLNNDAPLIIFRKGLVNVAPQKGEEAYRLSVNQQNIVISANTPHGAFNGLQTLLQLLRDKAIVPGVEISDYPAFSWRGYMVDVGRNYQSMDMLKQQISIAARYKLNVFHFHLTEDIAWRLEIKEYPKLTAANNMSRNAGAYYTQEEIKELIDFCKQRYMTFVPEVDMPGHSTAFKRALGVDMQSDSGLRAVKKIIKEVCQTFDVPYIHIGGDEVKISNPQFLPEVTRYIHQLGKKTIGWSPGGNLDTSTIRQLWMSEGAVNRKLKYIDSRNFYINHMDPLESVVSIYNRKIGDLNGGDSCVLGGTLCLWPDRNVIRQEDIARQNPVYPAMLAFAERSWVGQGKPGWNITVDNNDSGFSEFESRIIDHQRQYFSDIPFPYARQSETHWKLLGPFRNKGDLSAKFAPEQTGFSVEKSKNYSQIHGGTIILRHFWYPAVQAIIANPTENTTYYVVARVWAEDSCTAKMWVGFYNISRSVATSTPVANTWDDRKSEIWINHQIVSPPKWKHGGLQGHIEQPLVDEGYEYRSPAAVSLRKGWNDLVVKLPVGSSKAANWQSPVKWMFTVAFVTPLGINYINDDQIKFESLK